MAFFFSSSLKKRRSKRKEKKTGTSYSESVFQIFIPNLKRGKDVPFSFFSSLNKKKMKKMYFSYFKLIIYNYYINITIILNLLISNIN